MTLRDQATQVNVQAPDAKSRDSIVRELVKTDLDRVVEIDRTNSAQSRRGFFEKRLAAHQRDPQSFISLGYAENGQLEGFVLAHLLDGEFGSTAPVAVLDAIGTSQTVRGHGGGRALFQAVERIARERNATALRTQANWSDQALTHFFAANGMALSHRLPLERACGQWQEDPLRRREMQHDEDLSRDRIPVRSLRIEDLSAVTVLDRNITGHDRSAYYRRKIEEAINEAGIRLSMLATVDGTPAGFVMARVDYGEFGETEPEAVMDTIGVDPNFTGNQIGSALMNQLLANLESLRVDRIRTEVDWDDFGLLRFLKRLGFEPSQRLAFSRSL